MQKDPPWGRDEGKMKAALQHGICLLAVAVLLQFCGCGKTVSLKPQVPEAVRAPEISRTIGIYHAPEFVSFRGSADVYGDLQKSEFPVGAASDRLLREAYPRTFRHFRYLTGDEDRAAFVKDVDAVLEPEIIAFRFPIQSMKGPYWAEVVYRVTLTSPERKTIYSWEVKGWGEAEGTVPGGSAPVVRSAEMAMEKAVERFIGSFRDVPELRRWALGIPFDDATAPMQMLRVSTFSGPDESKKEGTYEGVVTVRAELYRIGGETEAQGEDAKAPRVYGVRVFVRNDGDKGLLLDPLTCLFVAAGDQGIDQVPGVYVSAVLSPRYGPIGPGEVGRESNPPMIFSLAEKAGDIMDRRELQAELNKLRYRGLRKQALLRGASAEGLLFFIAPPSGGALRGDLMIPVIMPDTATRYMVGLPLQEPPQKAGQSE